MTTSSLTMDMVITNIGVQYLSQTIAAHQLGYFSGFRFGSLPTTELTPDTTNVGGAVTYFGSPTEMTYGRINKYEILLRAGIDHNKGDFDIGSFAILAGPNQIPFFVGKLSYIHKKMASTANQVGGRFTLPIKFKMYQVDSYWSFANMTATYAAADETHLNILDVPDTAVESLGYMVQIDTPYHIDQRKGYLLYPGYKGLSWRSPDHQVRNSSSHFWEVNGGQDGDGHLHSD